MEGKKPVGFDVEVAQALAEKMGLTLAVISTPWDGIIQGLKAKKYDMVMSAMTITPDLQQQINISDPYYTSDQSVAVRKDSPIKNAKDLKCKVVGVQISTTGQTKAEELQPKIGIKEIKKYETIDIAFEALEQGKIDAIINDYTVNYYEGQKRGKTVIAAKIPTSEKYKIGVRKDDTVLLNNINRAFQSIKADGTYATIYKKYFGVAPPAS